MKRLVYGLLITASGCALVNQLLPTDRPHGMAATSVRLGRGPEVMAGAVAMEQILLDSRNYLTDAGSLAPDGGVQDGGGIEDQNLDYHRCYLDPATYEVWVERSDGGTSWRVVVLPKANCSAGSYGGGGEFEIDGESFQILRGEIYE